jgi:hypothetical protein
MLKHNQIQVHLQFWIEDIDTTWDKEYYSPTVTVVQFEYVKGVTVPYAAYGTVHSERGSFHMQSNDCQLMHQHVRNQDISFCTMDLPWP